MWKQIFVPGGSLLVSGMIVLCGLILIPGGCTLNIPRSSPQQFCEKVTGVVTLDSQPLGQARVILIPYHLGHDADTQNPISFGTTDEQGRYELKMSETKSGAVAGQHYVVISRPDYVPELELEKLLQLSKSQAKPESSTGDAATTEPEADSNAPASLPILRFLEGAERHDLVPAQYNSQSTLRIEIKPGAAQVVDFALTSKTP